MQTHLTHTWQLPPRQSTCVRFCGGCAGRALIFAATHFLGTIFEDSESLGIMTEALEVLVFEILKESFGAVIAQVGRVRVSYQWY